MRPLAAVVIAILTGTLLAAQAPPSPDGRSIEPDWRSIEQETLRHFQALLRMDTSDPPGREQEAAEYLKRVLDKEGIAVDSYSLESHRPNIVARIKGNGRKRPVLLMAHTDVVNVDAAKWTHPPFAAVRAGGHVYGRGALDDKDHVATGLMVMLTLKRLKVPLDRDVIFLAEAGEEGSTRVGIQHVVNEHFGAIDAEYCFAEGGGVIRQGGAIKHAVVTTVEKTPRAIELTARGVAGHGSVPLRSNPVVHLASAIARIGEWRPPIRLNETTRAYFERLAAISSAEAAARYRAVLDPNTADAADQYFLEYEPQHASMLRLSVAPTMISGGYRVNVIPSEAKATLDVRTLPGDDTDAVLEQVRAVVNDPAVGVEWVPRDVRPAGTTALGTEAFPVVEAAIAKHFDGTTTLPMMMTGGTDMAYLRAKGMQCYGVGPVVDVEDGPQGFGAHSDQERIVEAELHRFVRFTWDVVTTLARAAERP